MPMTPSMASEQIRRHLATIPTNAQIEIAFFGGSFTAIPRSQMESLLQVASPYLASGRVSSIRISTRPDAIDENVLSLLSSYGVKTIELGIQSISDKVLQACNRGHTSADSYHAAELILAKNFTLGGQMMIGLPSSSDEDELATAKALIEMGVTEARIYPVVVFSGTPLADEMAIGRYVPLSVNDATRRTVSPLEALLEANVTLLRVGLMETESLHSSGQIVGGAYHPALGELCYSALFQKRIMNILSEMSLTEQSDLKISVAPGKLSMAIGQKRWNDRAIKENHPVNSLRFAEDPSLSGFAVRVDLIQQTKGSI